MLYSKPTGDYKYLVEFSGNIIRTYTETYLSNYIDDFDAAAADADDNIGKQGQFPLTFLGIFVSVSRGGGEVGGLEDRWVVRYNDGDLEDLDTSDLDKHIQIHENGDRFWSDDGPQKEKRKRNPPCACAGCSKEPCNKCQNCLKPHWKQKCVERKCVA